MPEIMLVNPRKRRKRRRNPARRKRRPKARRRTTVTVSNPRRRRRRSRTTSIKRYRRNPRRRFDIMGFAQNTLMPSAVGAAGALGLDVLMGVLPLPPQFKAGPFKPVVRLLGAMGIGAIAGMVTTRKIGEQVAAGATVVVVYDILKTFIQRTMPQIPLGDVYDDYPALDYVNAAPIVGDVDDDMGMYVSEGMTDEVGEYVS